MSEAKKDYDTLATTLVEKTKNFKDFFVQIKNGKTHSVEFQTVCEELCEIKEQCLAEGITLFEEIAFSWRTIDKKIIEFKEKHSQLLGADYKIKHSISFEQWSQMLDEDYFAHEKYYEMGAIFFADAKQKFSEFPDDEEIAYRYHYIGSFSMEFGDYHTYFALHQ